MRKALLVLLILFSLGVVLLASSWLTSYPLQMNSQFDFVFNHVSAIYWLSLPILYVALYFLVIKVRNKTAKFLVLFGIVLAMQSMAYFYYRIPGSDSQSTRGLTEYFFNTGDLDPSRRGSYYFQWPSLFVLERSASLVPGLDLSSTEFMLFTVVLFMYVAGLYAFASRYDNPNTHFLVLGFFIITPYIFEFQLVPLFVGIGILFTMLLLQARVPSRATTFVTLILFAGVTLTHALVPIFFMLYTLMRAREKNQRQFSLRLLLGELVIYSAVSSVYATSFLVQSVQNLGNVLSSTYGSVLERTLIPARAAPRTLIDILAQSFSRVVTIGTLTTIGLGFIILFARKQLKKMDVAILYAGGIYTVVGFILPILGERSLVELAAVLCLGAMYYTSRYAKWFKVALLCFLLMFMSIQISSSFLDAQTLFQTKTEYQSANFLLENILLVSRPDVPVSVLSHFRTSTYLFAKGGGDVLYETDFSEGFPANLSTCDYVLYTIGLGKSLLRVNLADQGSNGIWSAFNILENNGPTFIASNPNSSRLR